MGKLSLYPGHPLSPSPGWMDIDAHMTRKTSESFWPSHGVPTSPCSGGTFGLLTNCPETLKSEPKSAKRACPADPEKPEALLPWACSPYRGSCNTNTSLHQAVPLGGMTALSETLQRLFRSTADRCMSPLVQKGIVSLGKIRHTRVDDDCFQLSGGPCSTRQIWFVLCPSHRAEPRPVGRGGWETELESVEDVK